MKRKAIIFPYNAECASLVRNRELLLNHEIVACVSPLNKVVIYLLAELFTALKGNDSKCPHWYGFKVAFFLKHDIFLRRCVL